jgi:hypothetical protein
MLISVTLMFERPACESAHLRHGLLWLLLPPTWPPMISAAVQSNKQIVARNFLIDQNLNVSGRALESGPELTDQKLNDVRGSETSVEVAQW